MSNQPTSTPRYFEGGAYRDEDASKLDFEGYLSPIVLQAYGQYMKKHQVQSDGQIRESDNWQAGFGDKHLDVCMKSAWRHFHDLWMEHRGYKSRDGIDEAINGLLFNIMAYYKKVLEDRNVD